MPTTMPVPAGRPDAVRRSWLLVLVVLGIVGMHGLAGGTGTTVAHHTPTAAHQTFAPASAGEAHAVQGDHGGEDTGTTLALCLVLLLSLGTGLLATRRPVWPVRPHTLPTRLPLPAAPLLRVPTPVPRFTVMRC